MTYYSDPDKITFDRAEMLVNRFIRQYSDVRQRITCKDVAAAYDIEQTQHNLIRLSTVLNEQLETTRETGSKVRQYEIP